MATGDRLDITARIQGALPRWFGDSHPLLDALLGGLATAWANLYALLGYTVQQARIQTASGAWLDLVAYDFFGNALARNANEEDGPFRARIIAGLLNEKCTRNAVIRVLATLTGRAPHIVEPLRPADTGGYGIAVGYGAGGALGSLLATNQAFILAYRQQGAGIPYVAGYGVPSGAYRTPSQSDYASIEAMQGTIKDADIYAAVESVRPLGTEVWVAISN